MTTYKCFVGFSSTDKNYFDLMKAWKNNDSIEFNFINCQLASEINSEDEQYIKRLCKERIAMSSTFIQLIGENTKNKYKYVRWEAEVAKEKGCRIICVNLNGDRAYNKDTCPAILNNIGAIFIPFNAKIIQYAIQNYKMHEEGDNYHYLQKVYDELGL